MSLQVLVNIRERKNSDTLYILGSGSSVNALSDTTWDEISRHVSVGINHWTLHSFVPDIYAVEPVRGRRENVGQNASALGIDHLNHLKVLDRPEVFEADPIVICLAPRLEEEHAQLDEMPDKLKNRAFVYYRYTPFTRVQSNIVSDYTRGAHFSGSPASGVVVPDSGATLIRLLGIAVKAGFRNVGLVGIDLSTRYFWQDHNSRLADIRYRAFPQPMVGEKHETTRNHNRPFSVVDVLRSFEMHFAKSGLILFRVNEDL